MSKERRKRLFWNEEKGFGGVIEKKRGSDSSAWRSFSCRTTSKTPHPSRSRSAFKAERPKRQITGSKQAILRSRDPRFAVDLPLAILNSLHLTYVPKLGARCGNAGWWGGGGKAASNKCRRYYLPFCWLFAFFPLWTSNWTTAPRTRLGPFSQQSPFIFVGRTLSRSVFVCLFAQDPSFLGFSLQNS